MYEQAQTVVTLQIDGKTVSVPKNTTILQAARDAGINIPTLCHHKDMLPDGSCRMCVVEVEGGRKGGLPTSCTELCAEGMVISTNSERVRKSRRFVLDLLLSNHVIDCFSCARNGDCALQDYSLEYGLERTSFIGKRSAPVPVDASNPFYTFDASKCIMCRRCARVCETLQGKHTLSIAERGFATRIATCHDTPRIDPDCELCGNCVAACPTGALSDKGQKNTFRAYEVKKTQTTCPHCAVGCQFNLLTKNNALVGVEPVDGPSNNGMLCVKGRYGSYSFVQAQDRLTKPLIKRDGEFVESSWDEALSLIADRLTQIKAEHGAAAIAGFSCSRATNEDNYLFQKMMRAGVGTNNVDNCARV